MKIYKHFNCSNHLKKLILLLIIVFAGLLSSDVFAQPLAQGFDIFLGGSTNSSIYKNFDKYWNQITPGNDGKWGSVEATKGQYNWTNLDKIYNYAISKNILFKDHVLIWGQQQPSWITSLDSAGQRNAVENWIHEVGDRYPLMSFIDVVNEPFNAPPSYKNALGGDGVTGWDWVITAFEWARQYCDPAVKLILNEYNVLHNNSTTNNYIKIINLLKERNLIDGVAIQGHYFEFRSDIGSTSQYVYNVTTIKNNLNKIAQTGVPVYISEFDIDEPVDSNQVAQYKIYFPIFWNNPAVKGITFWGYYQNDVWNAHPNTYLLLSSGRERPAMEWLKNFILIPHPPVVASPDSGEVAPQKNALLSWYSSDSANSYHVQLSSNKNFTAIIIDSTISDTVLQLDSLAPASAFFWRVNASNNKGTSDYSEAANFQTEDIVSIEELGQIPSEFNLSQNYPNPFNPTTIIKYSIPEQSYVTLKIYNILGREVATLFAGIRPAGNYEINFDGRNFVSGVYIYQLKTNNFVQTKKLILLK